MIMNLKRIIKIFNSNILPLRNFLAIGVLLLLIVIGQTQNIFGEKDTLKPVAASAWRPEQKNQAIGLEEKSGLVTVLVEGGTYVMGSPADEPDRNVDECQHQVQVHSFQIGKFEVTQADWMQIMDNVPANFKNCEDCPVENVSWKDVQRFIEKLNAKYPGKNYRLPSEAEWEYAARGGSKNKGYRFSGSNDLSEVAWWAENSNSRPQPVGGKLPNELGIYDMSGNVREWCEDELKPYPCESDNASFALRIYRGGSWYSTTLGCRVAYRANLAPDLQMPFNGFRLAADTLR